MIFTEPEQLVQLRKKSVRGRQRNLRKPWPSREIADKKRYEMNLKRINQAIDTWFLGLRIKDVQLALLHDRLNRSADRQLDFFDRRLYRVFNDGSTRLGGRFYGGWWQQVPREYRKHIYLAKPGASLVPKYCVEIDFRHIQPALLYAKKGLPIGGDAYDLTEQGIPCSEPVREVIKQTLLTMLNISSARGVTSAVMAALRRERIGKGENAKAVSRLTERQLLPAGCPTTKEIAQAILFKHKKVADQFYAGVGKQLMFIESNIAEQVMLRMIESGGLALPIHDSFLVQRGFRYDLEQFMEEEFSKQTGQTCRLKREPTELEDAGRGGEVKVMDIFDTRDLTDPHSPDAQCDKDAGTFHALFDDWLTTYGRKVPETSNVNWDPKWT